MESLSRPGAGLLVEARLGQGNILFSTVQYNNSPKWSDEWHGGILRLPAESIRTTRTK